MSKRMRSSAIEWDSLPRQLGWRLTCCAVGGCCLAKKRRCAFWIQRWELAYSIRLYFRFLRQPKSVQQLDMKLILIMASQQISYGMKLELIFISKILLQLQYQRVAISLIF